MKNIKEQYLWHNKGMQILLIFAILMAFSCSRPQKANTQKEEPFPVKYENEVFSINLPKGWKIDDSGLMGLDSLQNEVDLYTENSNLVWFHVVKTFLPIQWKNVNEATEMAITARNLSNPDNVQLVDRIDSVEVGGYPSNILYFFNFVDGDTIVQKQFVTYVTVSVKIARKG